ncbi:tetratricopeptide repeat protein [Xanthomonas nasturtii]|uniref:tetratricopeptide repeat protein n=1 Tax=Xanthomonas nasturtii TaxID=1843581 RepID=UPI002B2230F2|nr:tetratricopeptide repeat protein [Xanthomonas nasturtii]MEA9579500.1 tetratricopeptide repeat protein [Xanthomonas nasturtii]
MSRVTRYKLTYLLVLAVLAAVVFLVVRSTGGNNFTLALAVVFLLAPGRLQGLLLRPLFRGQRALAHGEAGEAMRHFDAQLSQLAAQPWRQYALWLGWSLYTPSLAAMIHNNLGVTYAELDEPDNAQAAWEKALALDPRYPVPYANLAALAASRGAPDPTQAMLEQAKALGYSGGALDQATHRVQQLLAAIESRGPAV